jgi:uncharacterized Zn finger protein
MSEQGNWWVEQWLDLINAYRFKKRLERGWKYAREGNVLSIRFPERKVEALVQGTEPDPYRVSIWLDPLSDEDWAFVIHSLSEQARWSALLLAGVMPDDIETAFAKNGLRLFPFNLADVHSHCSCPDKANPCKHVSAVFYLLGDRFAEDPFVLFQLRGRSREQLLEALRQQRQPREGGVTMPVMSLPPPNMESGWRYEAPLPSELVVITPSSDSESLLDRLGPLPFGGETQDQNAAAFWVALREIYGAIAHRAMLKAMATGTGLVDAENS